MRLLPAVVLGSAFLIACAEGARREAEGARREGEAETPGLTAVEALRIGSVDDPEEVFTAFWQLRVGPDGRIYTLHPQEHRVLIHNSEGRRVASFGREGEGPGEFRNAYTMGLMGDTLWLLDFAGYRFLYYDRDGEHLGTVRVPIHFGEPGEPGPPRPDALLADGTIVAAQPNVAHLVAIGDMTTQLWVTMTPQGAVMDTLGYVSVENSTLELTVEGVRVQQYGPQPFLDSELFQVSRSGHGIVRVHRAVGPDGPEGLRVTRTTLAGDTVFVRSDLPVDTVPITEEEVEAFVGSWARQAAENVFAGTPEKRLVRALLEQLYNPGFHPPVSEMVLGHDGTIWLKGVARGEEEKVRWTVLDADGSVLGRVGLPRFFRVLDARRDRVWGLERDELHVPYIVSYQIAASDGSSGR